MENLLDIFKFEEREIRVIMINDEPWFVAKDVCEVLEISNPTDMLKRLDDDERGRFNLGRQGETNIINEYGLFSIVLGSRKP
ncbi:Bro-N domain-containing protein, partial [Escherichia coli]|uniref:BRO-N domain-containing protein n=1 Tax=Escherichia coli TaxID=562 RepID=UPI003079E2CE